MIFQHLNSFLGNWKGLSQIIVQLKGWRDLRGLVEFAQSLIVDHFEGKSHSFIHLLYNSFVVTYTLMPTDEDT